jgi:hypothetical protein
MQLLTLHRQAEIGRPLVRLVNAFTGSKSVSRIRSAEWCRIA